MKKHGALLTLGATAIVTSLVWCGLRSHAVVRAVGATTSGRSPAHESIQVHASTAGRGPNQIQDAGIGSTRDLASSEELQVPSHSVDAPVHSEFESTLKRYGGLPDWTATDDGVHLLVYRDPVRGLYSTEELDRRKAVDILAERLSNRFDQSIWNECLMALERFERMERHDLITSLFLTGQEQGIDLQLQELRQPDARRRFDALDRTLGALGGNTRHSDLANAWLSCSYPLQPLGTTPAQVVLNFVERIEPLAQMIATDDPESFVRDRATLVVQRCEEAKQYASNGAKVPGMQYPDGVTVCGPQTK